MAVAKLMQLAGSFKKNPGYVAMRSIARFRLVRHAVKAGRHYAQKNAWKEYKQQLRAALPNSVFANCDPDAFVAELRRDGVAFGLALPPALLAEICAYTDQASCYADREPEKGFMAQQRGDAEAHLGKPVLVAQYLNTEKNCPAIEQLRNDPFLLLVAAEYLGSIPTHVGTNCWWTFPVDASAEDRVRHAHVFHSDLDDFSFFKFFFYLSDVENDGAHVCVPGSHTRPPRLSLRDHFLVRRWRDQEIEQFYGEENILSINGKAGTGFAEDTYCMHKGSTPMHQPRLLLQMQFALFDYGVQHDNVAPNRLKQIADVNC
ncbi:hypothetical protein IGS61_12595 [Janthinobacterium sp. FW305-129]|uniref:hypothetical protein n=1 Tax=Janthinobacterium sp. FW305-129 TaxID=2775054 RepID=UPI001E2AD9B1|nr:hypothetical protein [Janthinobacterium sp. FW305-129]MCC7598331.1 hypothetical protein [Janthinobacterium sp. FW305-129]